MWFCNDLNYQYVNLSSLKNLTNRLLPKNLEPKIQKEKTNEKGERAPFKDEILNGEFYTNYRKIIINNLQPDTQ